MTTRYMYLVGQMTLFMLKRLIVKMAAVYFYCPILSTEF